jgi:amino acid transporter
VSVDGLKRLLVGPPRASGELRHQLLPKWMALPVFSSDTLSSNAYATQELMLILAAAGAAAYSNIMPLAIAVAVLLVIVVVSYRQTVRAYPQGGGAYRVSRENLGEKAGLTAGAALLADYTLTVAVSIAAGVAAIIAAFPALAVARVPMALAFVAVVTIANLRGVREAGLLFAVPTYLFIVTMLGLIGWGLVQCLGGCPQAPSAGLEVEPEQTLTLFLLLQAFSSGATALTGVEAISDGVTAFRYPQSRNAATTLAIMAALAVTIFLGVSFLASATNVAATEETVQTRTVNADIAIAVFGGEGPAFYLVQFVTAAILILAANTAYADFPRLVSFLAMDRFLPRQFISRGDRLVFSNGILLLAAGACVLLLVFRANLNSLIQLYVVGVFTSFTLSQTGMVLHHRKLREPNWQRGMIISGIGAVTTAAVLVIVSITKFVGGAWIVIVAIPVMVMLMSRIHEHYQQVSMQLRAGLMEEDHIRPQRIFLVIDRVDDAAARGLGYAQGVGAASIEALAVPVVDGIEEAWRDLAPDVPLRVVAPRGTRDMVDRLAEILVAEEERHPEAFTTALICEELSRNWFEQLLEHRLDLRIKTALLDQEVVVTDVTAPSDGEQPLDVEEPIEHHVVVLVSAVHKATMRAVAFARGLQPTTLRALSVNLSTDRSSRILQEWEDWDVRVPLELIDSPFRSINDTVQEYVREFRPDGRRIVVTCVLPDFQVSHWYQQPLHNQTALLIKGMLLFERGVVTTSVPYQLLDEGESEQPTQAETTAP